jgi:hypothetical protein
MSEWSAAETAGRLPASFLGLDRPAQSIVEGRPCSCGVMVWANPERPAEGVRQHNATIDHLAWWECQREAWGEE